MSMKGDKLASYIRVGTDYFRISLKPSAFKTDKGEFFVEEFLAKWNKGEIETDYGKDALQKIKKYIGFCNIPNHTNFQREVKGFYNQYFELKHKLEKGDFENTKNFLVHIFGEQYELGLDYLALLYLEPTKRLPILCLVSEEQITGKSTFLFWLKDVFDSNVTLNSNEDFESKFNSDWTNKLVIGVEETLIEKKMIYEQVKRLATTGTSKTEKKGKDKTEGEFFGKFILCSNYETTFVPMAKDETRFWVRKINTVRGSVTGEITNLREKMKEEIPAFLHFLKERGYKTPNTGRSWFAPELYATEALQACKNANRPKAEQEILEVIGDRMELHGINEICFAAKDLYALVKEAGLKSDKLYIDRIIKENLKKEQFKNSSYTLYLDEEFATKKCKGRYYKFTYAEIFGEEYKEPETAKEIQKPLTLKEQQEQKEKKKQEAKERGKKEKLSQNDFGVRTLKNEDFDYQLLISENERLKEQTKRFSQDL